MYSTSAVIMEIILIEGYPMIPCRFAYISLAAYVKLMLTNKQTDGQTDRQTSTGCYVIFLAEVLIIRMQNFSCQRQMLMLHTDVGEQQIFHAFQL